MKNLNELYSSFELGIRTPKAVEPKEYLKSIGLDYTDLRIGFNSGQFHHRQPQEVKDHYENLGLLVKSDVGVREEHMTAYTVFGRYSIVFPLVDRHNQIVNFFAIRFNMSSPVEQYLNGEGIYPSYPATTTQRLFIVPSIVEAASFIQSRIMENRDAVIALHDGKLNEEHHNAIQAIAELKEIIILKP